MNPRQQKFVEGYLAGKSAKQAYLDAGYKVTTNAASEVNASRLLSNAKVAAQIEAARRQAAERQVVSAETVIAELKRLALSRVPKLFREDGTMLAPHEWDEDTAAAVSGVETDETTTKADGKETVTTRARKVKLWDKKGALELLGKQLGMFKDRLEVSGPGGGPVPVKVLKGVSVEDL